MQGGCGGSERDGSILITLMDLIYGDHFKSQTICAPLPGPKWIKDQAINLSTATRHPPPTLQHMHAHTKPDLPSSLLPFLLAAQFPEPNSLFARA